MHAFASVLQTSGWPAGYFLWVWKVSAIWASDPNIGQTERGGRTRLSN